MAAAPPEITTTVTELADSRVRVEAEVPAEEVQRGLEQSARALGRSMRLPGFRKGKVPPPVVIRRLGRDAVLDEAVRERLPRWYLAAIAKAGIAPVGDPDISLGELPGESEPLRFTVEIGVRPRAKLGNWRGLEVARREPAADEETIERELEGLRERLARLETVGRPASAGDFVVIDYAGSIDGEPIPDGEGRDQLVELTPGRVIPGFEEGLRGSSAGEERSVEVTFPDDYDNEQLAGNAATFAVTVKEVKEKRLPELDDDFALEAAGFDTLEELREDMRKRLLELDERRVESEYRNAVLDAAAEAATVTVPDALIDARAREAWERTLHSLSHQGISKDAYLRIAGRSEDDVLAEARPDAERSLRREAVVAALAEELAIEPSDEQLEQELAESASADEGGRKPDPAELLASVRKAGRLEELREDVAARMAVDALVEAAKPIDPGRAAARERLWTPGKR